MSQRTALLAAAGITAFILVLIGGLVARTAAAPPAAAPAVAPGVVQFDPGAAPAGYPVTASLAGVLAQTAAPGARLVKTPELVDFEGRAAYEVTTAQGLIYVDASTGQVLYNGAAALVQPRAGADGENEDEHGEHGDDD